MKYRRELMTRTAAPPILAPVDEVRSIVVLTGISMSCFSGFTSVSTAITASEHANVIAILLRNAMSLNCHCSKP